MRPYEKPQLVEYGRIDQLTLGNAASFPDHNVIQSGNARCDPGESQFCS